MESLRGGLALVTGAGGGVGRATTAALAGEGMRVVMVDRDPAALDAATAGLDENACPVVLDVSDGTAVAEACAHIRGRHGVVSVLVNNAGVLSTNKAQDTTPEEWRRVLGVNLDGAFLMSREWLSGMRAQGWGRIINVCSLAMKSGGLTAGTAYTASKGGLGALTFSLARETARDGVTVNGIAPGYIKTPMVTEQLTAAQRKRLLQEIPVGRFCEAEEVAHVVRFLASPLSGFITGEIVDINGGLHLD